jgi:ubiquitin fusion degradation protein 1
MWNLKCLSDIILDTKLDGDKVRLPQEILSQYIGQNNDNLELKFPISFKLKTLHKELIISVLDFSGTEDIIIVPEWMFYNLYPLELGDNVTLSIYSGGYTENVIPKGSMIRLRPHSYEFLNICDHKTVLENHLKQFGIINQYTTISINYCDEQFDIDIIETKPENIIDIIDIDLQVEFVEPVQQSTMLFDNDFLDMDNHSVDDASKSDDHANEVVDKVVDDADNTEKFIPFTGKGYVLGSK